METTIVNTSDVNLTNLNLVTDAGEKKVGQQKAKSQVADSIKAKSQAADSFKVKMSGMSQGKQGGSIIPRDSLEGTKSLGAKGAFSALGSIEADKPGIGTVNVKSAHGPDSDGAIIFGGGDAELSQTFGNKKSKHAPQLA